MALERSEGIPDEDLAVLGYHEWLDGLERGVAAHHAGLLPIFKEVVEELFQRGLVRAVFATETLALGINMPARCVVLERLVKWNGEAHVDVTPGEYTQLTGRAGRRGIDVEGHAVVLWQPNLDPRSVAGLASTRTYPLRSSFRPSYNMAVNLVGQFGRHTARELLESSFAQFQADRAVVGMARQVRKQEEALDGYLASMSCHLGDFEEYARLRRELSDREAHLARDAGATRRAAAAQSLERLQPGDVIPIPGGRKAGFAVVVQRSSAGGPPTRARGPWWSPPPARSAGSRWSTCRTPVVPVDRLRLPKAFNARNGQMRRDLASALRAKGYDTAARPRRGRGGGADEDAEVLRLRAALRAHPCHGCDQREDHARWAERYWRLRRETEQLERRVEGRTNTIARTFDRVCGLLESLGYLDGDRVTEEGLRLGRLYSEFDLLAAECLRDEVWDGLTPAELAACASALVYESRQADDAAPPKVPSGRTQDALAETVHLWGRLDLAEKDHGLSFQREPDLGFAWAAYRWASGQRLERVLTESGMQAGDFVRWTKQLADLLGQVADAAPAEGGVRQTAFSAVEAIRRGVVAYSSVG